jgi:hypothetical protein
LVSVGLKESVGWWRDWVGGEGMVYAGGELNVAKGKRLRYCATEGRVVVGLEERGIGARGESES